MSEQNEPGAKAIIIGRGLQALVVLALLADAAVQFFLPNVNAEGMKMVGLPMAIVPLLGTIMLVCAILYAWPKTAVLGAIMTTGFLGGAICVNLRAGPVVSPPIAICVILGLLTWLGLYLQDRKIRDILPVRS